MISVVIPAYNAAKSLRRAIDSVLAQTYKDYEIIIINDGSTDATEDVAKDYGNKIVYHFQENAGVSVARNQGVKHAKGKWISFLDADDEFLPEKLEWEARILAQNPHLGWCAGNYYRSDGLQHFIRVDEDRLEKALADRHFFDDYFHAATAGLCAICSSSITVRKDAFLACGGFEPGRTHGEDVDFFWRMAYRHSAVGYSTNPLTIVHMDVYEPSLDKRRKEAKRGTNEREIVARHLNLSREFERYSAFKPCASKLIKDRLLVMLFHGYAEDAKATISHFPELFPVHWRVAGRIATKLPKTTSTLMHTLASLSRLLGLERDPGRRWLHKKKNYGQK
jgi:glycosyltransferase involved in cell wall biosynthesis